MGRARPAVALTSSRALTWTMAWTTESENKTFGGVLAKYAFSSESLGGITTRINVFVPPGATDKAKVPVLYYLAGLTCTEDNGAQKGGFFETAAKEGIALVFPDTSPRDTGIEGEDDEEDVGTGAGFYVNATRAPWSKYYHMYDFVSKELPKKLADSDLPIDTARASIMGHSMGGHGALVLYLREPEKYRAVSAFAPVCHPVASPLGQKAFPLYLEGGLDEGKAYDAVELLGQRKQGERVDIYVDCGLADNFYNEKKLLPEDLVEAAAKAGLSSGVQVNMREGYSHSYYFVSTFAADHVRWHAKFLRAP